MLDRSVFFVSDYGPSTRDFSERATRIELAFSAWEADVLPLNYARELASD
jgi:hypothetical protein